jgi:hypothetical protein
VVAVTAPAFGARQVQLGWRFAPSEQEPGPPPRRPVPPPPTRLDPGWLAAQRREERLLSRPARAVLAASTAALAAVLALGQAGLLNPALTALAAIAAAAAGARSGRAVWRSRQWLRASVEAESRRVAAARAAQERGYAGSQQQHAAWFRAWQAGEQAFARQPRWHPVALPGEIQRIDVAGGTLAGWSALLTMIAVPRLEAGGEVTVLDLSEGAVARDLVEVAARRGLAPLVWLLPGDLPRFDLGAGLPADGLADVLAETAAAGAADGHDPAADHAILRRVLEVLADGASIGQVAAGLRALGQVGDPRADVAAGLLTAEQLERITCLFGRGAADRVVIGRALALEARLRVLAGLGTDPVPLPPSRLRVAALARDGGAFGNAVLGPYLAVSLTHLLRRARPGPPWRHTVCLAGAETLPAGVLDRLTTACEATRAGLVLAYRSVPAPVKARLGRGNAALAVMRLGNAEDAKVVSEQIGTEHRFVISQFTDTVGASVSDTAGDSYTSTVGTSGGWSGSVSTSRTSGRGRGRGHSRGDAAPFAPRTGSSSSETSQTYGSSDSRSLTDGISAGTSWGVSTSRALGTSESLARTAQRSREFLVEPHELQQLPASAVIVSYASPAGRQVVLADANPAILTLPAATLGGGAADRAGPADGAAGSPVSRRTPEGRPPPNLGPPPPRPDWRRQPRHRRR